MCIRDRFGAPLQISTGFASCLWSPYVIGQTIIFLSCDFYLLPFFLFFSPNLSGRRLDVYHTSAHGVALVRSARGSLKIQDAKMTQKIAIWASSHNFSGYIFATKARIDKFQRVSRLDSVTARHCSSGRQPNFARLNGGRHLYSAGRPSRWTLAYILVT